MDADDRKLFEASVRQATRRSTGSALDAALADLGWPDALVDDAETAVSIRFEQQGAANVSSGALDHVIAHALGFGAQPEAVVLPIPGHHGPPAHLRGDQLTVRGIGTHLASTCENVIVVAVDGDHQLAIRVPLSALSVRPVGGLDPELGLVEVGGDVNIDALGAAPVAVEWSEAVAAGQLALAHELVGVARAMLELAREHAVNRVQFGRPIGSFQAVRHRLADSMVAIDGAVAVTGAAWEEPSELSSSMAKTVAGQAARLVARHAQQVLAGIGFTMEHRLHHYLRRALVLDELFGSSRRLTDELGQRLLATRQLPDVLPL
jgi:hypothetical protein